ncbi:glycosyl hydrolase family 28-related protein [Sphingomonas sp. Tas61C01]|uniref:glycosyl hydrolase family 28-related protein n=1 Tax=Sphingomonas sp. Tas61C01 TaxID=3458297 RepID=UPI00403EDDB1
MSDPIPRRTALALAAVPAMMLGTSCAAAPASPRTASRNVRDFGAKGDGVTDDTEAFNRATQADAEWSWDLLSSIIVPAGKYRLKGTVFLRKGQSLIGEGLSTYIDASGVQRSTFIMGRRRDKGRGVEDPGGLPVRLESLMGLGGAPSEGFVYATIPGFQISALFLTAVGLGIEVEAADGIISDVEIDQCLTGVLIRNSQNVVFSNLNMYLANYGMTFAGDCRDIAVTNAVFCYTKYASVLLGDGARNITAVTVSNCVFTNNVPYDTFEGYIYSRASHSDLTVTACTFRNAPAYAVNQGAGVDLALTLSGCIFDGERTNPAYNQSLAAKGIRTGNGRFLVTGCVFRRLSSEAVRVGPGLVALSVQSSTIETVARDAIRVDGDPAGTIAINDVRGVVHIATGSGGEHQVSLPWLGPRARWQVTVNGRDADAPTAAAHFVVAPRPTGVLVQQAWSLGATASVGAARGPARQDDTPAGIRLRFSAREFGGATPTIEAAASA